MRPDRGSDHGPHPIPCLPQVSLPEWHQRVRLAQETLLLTKELMLAEQGTREWGQDSGCD